MKLIIAYLLASLACTLQSCAPPATEVMEEVATISGLERLRHAAEEIRAEFDAANPNQGTRRKPEIAVLMSSSASPGVSSSSPALWVNHVPDSQLDQLNQIIAKALAKHKIPEVMVERSGVDDNNQSFTSPPYQVVAE